MITSSALCFRTDRDSDRDRERERDSIFRIRDRTRWLDSMREDSSVLRLERDRTDGISLLGEPKKQIGLQNPLSFGEDLQYWTDKVTSLTTNYIGFPITFSTLSSLMC